MCGEKTKRSSKHDKRFNFAESKIHPDDIELNLQVVTSNNYLQQAIFTSTKRIFFLGFSLSFGLLSFSPIRSFYNVILGWVCVNAVNHRKVRHHTENKRVKWTFKTLEQTTPTHIHFLTHFHTSTHTHTGKRERKKKCKQTEWPSQQNKLKTRHRSWLLFATTILLHIKSAQRYTYMKSGFGNTERKSESMRWLERMGGEFVCVCVWWYCIL